jgi:hypothetical protein
MGLGKGFVQGFGGKSGRKETLRRPKHTRKDNIKMDLRELRIGWVSMDRIILAQDRDQWRTLL